MKAIFLTARVLDVLWWIAIFTLCYAAYSDALLPPGLTLVLLLWRWVVRGLYGTHVRIQLEQHERRHGAH